MKTALWSTSQSQNKTVMMLKQIINKLGYEGKIIVEESPKVIQLTEERDAYATAMAIALKEGVFFDKNKVYEQIEKLVGPYSNKLPNVVIDESIP